MNIPKYTNNFIKKHVYVFSFDLPQRFKRKSRGFFVLFCGQVLLCLEKFCEICILLFNSNF